MRKLMHVLRGLQQCRNAHISPPLFYKNAEINASPSGFATMQKYTHLLPLFYKNAEINGIFSGVYSNAEVDTSPPCVLQKCENSSISPL
jgi:hypothetical protein